MQGHLRQTGHSEEYLQNMVHWRTKQQPIPVFLPGEPMNSMKRQKETTLKAELPRLVGALYATGEEWRNSSRKNEGAPVHRVTKSQNWT